MLPDDGGGEGVGDGEQEGHHGARPASSSQFIIHFKMFKKNYLGFSINFRKCFPKLLQNIDNLWPSIDFGWLVFVFVLIFDGKLFPPSKKFFPNSENSYRNHFS